MNVPTRERNEYRVGYQIEFLSDEAAFDVLSLCSDAMFTQSHLYYRWQIAAGKSARHFVVKDGTQVVAYAQCFFYSVRFLGNKGYWYAPYGPVFAPNADRQRVFNAIMISRELFSPSVFFRCDPCPVLSVGHRDVRPSPCRRFVLDGSIQPRADWLLTLSKAEGELLADMHQKSRYSIQYAQRKGVEIRVVSSGYAEYLKDFLRLMSQTSKRDRFVPHSDRYYEALLSELERSKDCFLVIGQYSGSIVSMAVVIGYGKTATYAFGASSDQHRNVSAPALVQWTAITEAKRRGYAKYNFGGVSSERYPVKTWAGITTFKQRFGGYLKEYSSLTDLTFQPFWYLLFALRKWVKRYIHI